MSRKSMGREKKKKSSSFLDGKSVNRGGERPEQCLWSCCLGQQKWGKVDEARIKAKAV